MVPENIQSARQANTITALKFEERVGVDGFPPALAWEKTPAICFCHDWQGKNADSKLETEVRSLWNGETLFFRFFVRFRTITVFADSEPSGRRDQLWDRDVAEVFLQPPELSGRNYKEFEVSPNGFWIDLDIVDGKKQDIESGLKRSVALDAKNKTWTAHVSLPMKSLTEHFDPSMSWRVNFYRVEGPQEPRFYSAWRATGTPAPNFHVPEAFGTLVFAK